MIKDIFTRAEKIIIKVGTSTIFGNAHSINIEKVANIAKLSAELLHLGKKVIIVSSGAIAAGHSILSFSTHDKLSISEDSIEVKQALSSIGQIKLLQAYRESFLPYYTPISQILLTNDDFQNATRKKNILKTIGILIKKSVVPIINENDTISTDEIAFGDNDMLASKTAILLRADLVLMLSNIDGVFDNPLNKKERILIEKISNVKGIREKIIAAEKSKGGTGGIESKLLAGESLINSDIPMFLTNGNNDLSYENFEKGKIKGTLFANLMH
ncbi:MAG: glutamate 5-kinase [Clostridiales Family XIII bacterium]|jgi:glutamate 5-kinase|nr:glutamate 5-kinase [Clostridiales Family XIII bacterium]